jgi:hypothetical protein
MMTNWDAIENDWRFTKKTNVAIATEYNISEGAIRKRVKREGWVKGEEVGVRQPAPPKTKSKAAAAPVAKDDVSPMEQTVEVAKRMLSELDAVTAHIGEIEDLICSETENDRDERRRNAMLKAVSLATRSTTLKTIQQTLEAAEAAQVPSGKKEAKAAAAKEVAQGPKFGAGKAPALKSVK